MFSILIKKLYWIDGSEDNPDDLCLHSNVEVRIGDEIMNDSCTVSATALYLLKSLELNHVVNEGIQFLPCCGAFLIADEKSETIAISGCPNGVDWSVIHEGANIRIITEKGTEVIMDLTDYKIIVFNFADAIKQFYDRCSEKVLPADDFSRNGYIMFWKEWNARRCEHHHSIQQNIP